jgi:pimeloyl-ACP methyl ester carboxylesterase
VVLPGVGHMMTMEDPGATIRAMRQIL